MIDLVGELIEAQNELHRTYALELRAAGIPPLYIENGIIGAANVTLDAEETLWEPGGTARAFITPCRIDPENPHGPESNEARLVPYYGELVDLVAWHPDRPDRWALRTGNACWLGACEPQMMGGRMRVRRSPLAWLKAGCSGVVALSPFWQERRRVLAIADTLIAEDFEHAQELRQLMERPSFVPNVKVGEPHGRRTGTVEA